MSVSSGQGPALETAESLAEFLSASIEMLVVLDPNLTVLGPDALASLVGQALGRPGLLTLLVPPGTPPPVTGVNHGPVRSFVGPGTLLQSLPVGPAELTPETLCYWSLWSVIHGADTGVIARECPEKCTDLPPWISDEAVGPPRSTAMIIAHRGPAEFLQAALGGLAASRPRPACRARRPRRRRERSRFLPRNGRVLPGRRVLRWLTRPGWALRHPPGPGVHYG